LLLLDVWPLRRFQFAKPLPNAQNIQPGASAQPRATGAGIPALLLEKIPFFAVSIAVCIITIISQKTAAAVAPLAAAPLLPRILNALLAYGQYLQKLIWPNRLSVIYLDAGNPPVALALMSAALLAVVTCVAWRLRKARPWLLVGWAWYLGTLVPVIGLVKVGNQSMADRYSYLPAIGIFVIAVWTVADLVNGRSKYRIPAALSAAGMLTAFSLVAQKQLMCWQNTETLFRHALSVTENNYIAYNSLGFYLADLGESRQAQTFLRTGISLNPASAPAWNKLGSVLLNQQHYSEALAACEMALQLNPRLPEAHTTFALVCLKQGNTNDALAHYSAALQSQPDYAPAHYNLANTLAHQGRLDEAREHYQAAIRSDPHSADTRNNLAYLLARDHRLDEAIFQFNTALRFRPGFWQAHYGLGEALAQQNHFIQAANEFSETLRLKPDLAIAHFQLALSLGRNGKLADALSSAGQAHLLAIRSGQLDLAEKSRLLQERLQASLNPVQKNNKE
jgi:tetratricopeptide (TPR) repeat protein